MDLPPKEANTTTNPPHPLHQIADNPAYKLLLKQWLKEEDLIAKRISLKESRLDNTLREITALYCTFFIFHSTTLLLLFGATTLNSATACRRSWLPCLFSLLCSMTIVWAIKYKTDAEIHLQNLLEREKEDGLLLGKCVEELKRKGEAFDLLKEVDVLRRAKSLRVEAKVVGKKNWSRRDFALMFFFGASCGVLGLTRFPLKICVMGYEFFDCGASLDNKFQRKFFLVLA